VNTHGRGLRQGDPLSTLLFVLAIDPLQRLLHLATEAGIMSIVSKARTRLRTSMYVDDAIIFVKPEKRVGIFCSTATSFWGSDWFAYLKRPDPLGLKCDTITSPRRLVNTFLTSNSTEFR
jgi:hypothetical protein